jgi:hypothetical protein
MSSSGISLAAMVLAAMLQLQPPGQTVYSLVPAKPDEIGVKQCSADTILCRAPFLAPGHGKPGQLFRYENAEEGKERYGTIAEAIAIESQKAVDDGRWPGDAEELAAYVLDVVHNESGFRRDVHSGKGPSSRGDNGRSWCLGQLLLGDFRKSPGGYLGKELVGITDERTHWCISEVIEHLTRAKKRCGPGTTPACGFSSYGGVSGDVRRDGRIAKRVKMLPRIEKMMEDAAKK